MKTLIKILAIIFVVSCTFSMKAQEKLAQDNLLENTEWQGIANIPSPETVILNFTKDLFTISWNDKVIEQMTYTVQSDKITMLKSSGVSPCPVLSQGTYKYTVLNDKLSFEVISDACSQRTGALGINVYSKVLTSE